ncbi:MAG: hypothetical protein KatS3mg002_1355 [Candidatus Woesearchaeota archaeon]|nr:MAG: hypothetical protein KatS3mg002_1355 [Candidatus Woesearchaeota archaeon]
MLEDYNTWVEIPESKNEIVIHNNLKTKMKVRGTNIKILPGETVTLIKSKNTWVIKNQD